MDYLYPNARNQSQTDLKEMLLLLNCLPHLLANSISFFIELAATTVVN